MHPTALQRVAGRGRAGSRRGETAPARSRAGRLAAAALAALLLAGPPARAEDPFLRRTATVAAVEKVGPAVVNITTRQRKRGRPFRPMFGGDPVFERFFNDLFEPRIPRQAQSLGSGVLIDAERHVVTNEHVVARAASIEVTLADGREFEAALVGADPNNDLAVLRILTDAELPWVPPGHSEDAMVGEPVIAIGNPFGLSNTVTTGVLSAVDRSLRTENRVYHGFFQTDASINPGNSGGPLLNAEGELIGINTAIYGGGAQGIGFAIPIDAARRVVTELLEHGEVAPVWVGLDLQDLGPRLVEVMKVPPDVRGALVSRVREGSPAHRSAVRSGDVLTRADGVEVRSARSFYEILERSTSGQQIELEVWRKGESRRLRVQAEEISQRQLTELGTQRLGLQLEAGERGGYVVRQVTPGSGASRTGIEPGDFILGINGQALRDDEALRRAVLDLRGRSRALIVVQRGRGRYHVQVPLG